MADSCIDAPLQPGLVRIGLGGGCHWCTEAVFASLTGIHNLRQGFISSTPPNDAGSEAVLLDIDECTIPLRVVIEVHLRTHASTSAHSLRTRYRSAVYINNDEMQQRCSTIIKSIEDDFAKPIITTVIPMVAFTPSDPRYHDYYYSNPDKPFCNTYIDPKLALLRREYRHIMKPNQ
jgi:peptide-methionine (S)-S-oxide reductase